MVRDRHGEQVQFCALLTPKTDADLGWLSPRFSNAILCQTLILGVEQII